MEIRKYVRVKKVYEFIKYRRTKHDLLGVGALLGASSLYFIENLTMF